MLKVALTLLALPAIGAAQTDSRPWQKLQLASHAEAARGFANPPPEYAMAMWWFWNSAMTEAEIVRGLDELREAGVRAVMIWPYTGVSIEYLSDLWFERVRYAVEQARARDMRVWLMDEGGYPSGFVGGKISTKYPELRMQVLEPPRERQEIAERLAPDAVAAYRTSPTRHVNNPGFPKDGRYSLFDPLNEAATQRFLAEVHEKYKRVIGHEFGRTVLGFMGDEPSVAGVPWTPSMRHEFERRKGYGIEPYLAKLARSDDSPEMRRVRADYYDVWTDLYSERFFRPQTEWCERNGLEYMVHLCGEEDMKTFLRLNGDYFKCNRTVQIPGVDAIWRQIWPGVTADYPKLASSAAHLLGRPRAFTESYAVYGTGISLAQAKWVMDQQFVRGINHFQAMEYLASDAEHRQYFHPPNWRGSPQWPHFRELATYSNRISYLLSMGHPTAEVALYYPTTSGWLGDFEADRSALAAAKALLDHQRDFDFVDEDCLSGGCTVRGAALANRSGQTYRAVIVPPLSAISAKAMATLEALARAGGRVIFLGKRPDLLVAKTFRDAVPPASAAGMVEPSGLVNAAVLTQLPKSDVSLANPARDVRYLHRRLRDAEVYFFFNEGATRVETEVALAGRGSTEIWDPLTGERRASSTRLVLEPHETKVIVLSPQRSSRAAAKVSWKPLVALDGDWSLDLGGRQTRGFLRTWSELGQAGFWGMGRYRKEFDIGSVARHMRLDLGVVNYSARVWLNGKDLGVRAWPPFRWEVAEAIRAGTNVLEVEVANTRANEIMDPARFAEIENKGWLRNSYIRTYRPFDAEMVTSGLLGPVRISAAR